MPCPSLKPRSIERAHRLQYFVQDNERPSIIPQSPTFEKETEKTTEEELDTFMASVTDKNVLEKARDTGDKKA